MTTVNEAERGAWQEGDPIGVAQLAGAIALYVVGFAISYALSAYDVKPMASVCLTALNAAFSGAALWWGLGLVRVSSAARVSAALWVPLCWDFLLLGQLPYIGFLFVPLEALVAALLLRRRIGLTWSLGLAVGVAVRLSSLAVTYAARPAAKALFPWSG